MKSVFLSLVLLAFPLSQIACTSHAHLTAPAGFAHMEGDYDDRISSARGVVIAARIEKNEPQANLDFWVEAIDLRLQKRGYTTSAPIASVKNTQGVLGRSLRYASGTNQYWVDVYVSPKHIVIVEATGRAIDLEASRKDVEGAMRDVRTNS